MLCRMEHVARVLGLSTRDAGLLIVDGTLASVIIPRLGRRVKASVLREYIQSLPTGDEEDR